MELWEHNFIFSSNSFFDHVSLKTLENGLERCKPNMNNKKMNRRASEYSRKRKIKEGHSRTTSHEAF